MNSKDGRISRGSQLAFPLFIVALTLLICARSNYHASHGNWVAGYDPAHYYMYARSLFMDGDLDFTNEVARIYHGNPPFQNTQKGTPPNVWSIGPAIFWMPFFAAGHALTLAVNDPGIPPDGYSKYYQSAAYAGNTAYVILGCWFLWLLLGKTRTWPDKAAFTLILLASQLPDLLLPPYLMAHGLAFTASTAFFHFALKDTRPWFAALAAGTMVLVRWQTATFVPIILIPSLLKWIAVRQNREEANAALREILRISLQTGGVVVLMFIPQLLAWYSIYGTFVLLPQGSSFLSPLQPRLWEILFAREHGLFLWHPVYALALLGFVLRRKMDKAGLLCFIWALGTQWYLNSIVHDWGAGWSFGNRRFIEILPLAAVGLSYLAPEQAAHKKAAGLALGAAVCALVWVNLTLLYQWRNGLIPRALPPTWGELLTDRFRLSNVKRARDAALDAIGAQIILDDAERFRKSLRRAEELNPDDRLLPLLKSYEAKLTDPARKGPMSNDDRAILRRDAEKIVLQ